jgi:hypothetical protein
MIGGAHVMGYDLTRSTRFALGYYNQTVSTFKSKRRLVNTYLNIGSARRVVTNGFIKTISGLVKINNM